MVKSGNVKGKQCINGIVATGINEKDPLFKASPAATITGSDINNWNNKSDFSGDYNELSNKPTINNIELIGNKTIEDLGIKGAPEGGLTGQVLAKKSDTDYDTEWVDQTGGGASINILNTFSNPFESNTEYYLGTETALTLTPPATANAGDYAYIKFTAGASIAVTVDETIVGDRNYTFVAGNTYEILLTYNGSNWLMQVLEY